MIRSIFLISDNIEFIKTTGTGAKAISENLTVVYFGEKEEVIKLPCSADELIYCPVTDEVNVETYARAVAAEIKKQEDAVVIFSNNVRCKYLASAVGVYLDCSVLSNVKSIKEDNGSLIYTRTVYGGAAERKEKATGSYAVITAPANICNTPDDIIPTICDNVRKIDGDPEINYRFIQKKMKKKTGVSLNKAKRIVDLGTGVKTAEDVTMMKELAGLLNAELGCSRPVAENAKLLPVEAYLGITGTQVRPEICLTVGISGQVQHMGGIEDSKCIIAINKTESAPIFENCDFGIIGDLYKIVPALIEKIKNQPIC